MPGNAGAMEEPRMILKGGGPLYGRGDISLGTAGRAGGDCLSEVVAGLRRGGIEASVGYTQTEDQ